MYMCFCTYVSIYIEYWYISLVITSIWIKLKTYHMQVHVVWKVILIYFRFYEGTKTKKAKFYILVLNKYFLFCLCNNSCFSALFLLLQWKWNFNILSFFRIYMLKDKHHILAYMAKNSNLFKSLYFNTTLLVVYLKPSFQKI